MFQTFTGTSRRPRQVNLSGRTKNPFATAGQGQPAVAAAQQERERRQRERDKLQAVRLLQRTWRGSSCRRKTKDKWREEWDREDAVDRSAEFIDIISTSSPYTSEYQALSQLSRLLQFVDIRDDGDITRLLRCSRRLRLSLQNGGLKCSGGPWPMSYLRLQKRALSALDRWMYSTDNPYLGPYLLHTIAFTALEIPDLTSRNASQLFRTLADFTHTQFSRGILEDHQRVQILDTVLLSLRSSGADKLPIYAEFACKFLSSQDLSRPPLLQWLDALAQNLDYPALSDALVKVLSWPNYGGHAELNDSKNRMSLLAHFIYLHQMAHRFQTTQAYASHKHFVHVISALLSSVADDMNLDELQRSEYGQNKLGSTQGNGASVADQFVREQILSLVNQESIGNLLSGARDEVSPQGATGLDDEAKQLASYALTLLRFFPRRGDEIRMWLYLSSTPASSASGDRIPTIQYFWQAARSSDIFDAISRDSRAAILLLKPRNSSSQFSWEPPHAEKGKSESIQDEWRVVLVFLELYTFILKLMDDEEFFSASPVPRTANGASATRSGYKALPLKDVRELTTFLKNLSFTMYFNAAEIADMGERESKVVSISSYFHVSSESHHSEVTSEGEKPGEITVAGLSGMSIDYVKGLVTGLLRLLYERDSRRKFLPKDHWLMTSHFDMDSFIPAVVTEEENRHKVQEEDDADVDVDEFEEEVPHLIGTARDQRIRNNERLRRQQRRASRKRYLQAVAPRLEILQNMPFFIPFETRVQIFRDFVRGDQMKRRHGFVDPDSWRMSVTHSPTSRDSVERHHAKIRRGHEFEDAYEQFYDLEDGLKEPIQITFVDKFDTVEAGIDGGGVTKEFLTSVTSQAFTPTNGLNMFIENDKHLLYPNPAALEEQKDILRQAGYRDGSAEFRECMNRFRQRYEFLGRIIGKCLYEGILVDINFANFFLLKWALTGGTGSAPRESGYRANLNDLRDLDEALYQGLLQLKNHPGDVEDFALNFTITDTSITDYRTGATKSITKELKPGGANIPVTNKDRLVYISYVARHRLQVEPYYQTTAFLRGLSLMIQPSWLSMFNQSELQTLLGGTSSSIDVSDLRQHTSYGGVYAIGDDGLEHPTIQLFWSVMESLSDEDRRKVLKFVTSTPRAPLLGFSSLAPKFNIRDSGDDESRLPSTSTCVNLLKLPRYKSVGVLREKLLYAVNAGAGFDLS